MIGDPRGLRKADRVMVLAPHPDDESIATGGVLCRAAAHRAAIRVVFLTDGENNPWAQRACERRWRIDASDQLRWGARRRNEALQALLRLGVHPRAAVFLELPDQYLMERLLRDPRSLTRTIADEIEAWRPSVLFVPSLEDRHPDHGATAILARLWADSAPAAMTGLKVLSYTVHCPSRLAQSSRAAVHLRALSLIERSRKREAILCHASQLLWRRRSLLGFADVPESFASRSMSRAAPAGDQALRLVAADQGSWTFAVTHLGRMMMSAPKLILIVQSDRRTFAVSFRLPLGSRWGILFDGTGLPMGEFAARRTGAELRVAITSPWLASVRLGFAKLDLIRERRLGFFDPWPWLDLTPQLCGQRARVELEDKIAANGPGMESRSRKPRPRKSGTAARMPSIDAT